MSAPARFDDGVSKLHMSSYWNILINQSEYRVKGGTLNCISGVYIIICVANVLIYI